MKFKWLTVFTSIVLASVVTPLQAADLMDVYYQALHADPTFKKAEADWRSARENFPIALSSILPQFNATGNYNRKYSHETPIFVLDQNGTNHATQYALTLTQPIFNFAAWKAISSARASVKAATATYAAASQDLMLRTARAYFSVLQAYDQLGYTQARKRAVYEQLLTARERFKVGLIAITGVYDARSVYDRAAATAIADQNRLNDTVEELREITGRYYFRMKGIGRAIPLVKPKPNDINRWVRVAEEQNYSLISQNFNVVSTRERVKQEAAGWMPQVDLVGQFAETFDSRLPGFPKATTETGTYGASVNFPLIQGGLVTAQTRQARYNYLSASSERQFVHRSVVSETRQSFLGIITGIAKIKADLQAVKSAQNALEATKAGYEVGTRTMVDVLDDLTALYLEKQRYTDDQYRYIIDTIELKVNAGTLSVPDLEKINGWLSQFVKLKLPKDGYSRLQHYHYGAIRRLPNKARLRKLFAQALPSEKIKHKKPHSEKHVRKHMKKHVKGRVKHQAKKESQTRLMLPAPQTTRLVKHKMRLSGPKQLTVKTKVRPVAMHKKQQFVVKKQKIALDDRVIPLYEKSKIQPALPSPA